MLSPVEGETPHATTGGFRREVTGVRKDGSQFPIELSLADTKVTAWACCSSPATSPSAATSSG